MARQRSGRLKRKPQKTTALRKPSESVPDPPAVVRMPLAQSLNYHIVKFAWEIASIGQTESDG
eukprot:8996988-Pyramimonas_sp.AAC.1